jgi:hypothetical protein
MLDRLIDDVRVAAGLAARQTFYVGAVAVSLFVTTGFLCAAAFVFVLERFGLIQACLTGAAVFFIVTLISAGSYLALKGGSRKRVVPDTASAAPSFVPNPMMLAAGLQIVRAVGFKRLVPVIAIAGLALGVLAARSQTAEADDESGDQ